MKLNRRQLRSLILQEVRLLKEGISIDSYEGPHSDEDKEELRGYIEKILNALGAESGVKIEIHQMGTRQNIKVLEGTLSGKVQQLFNALFNSKRGDAPSTLKSAGLSGRAHKIPRLTMYRGKRTPWKMTVSVS